MNTQHLVDLDKIPPDERPHIKDIAVKHNALASDFTQVAGETPEEVEATGRITMALRFMGNQILSAASKTITILLPLALLSFIMKNFGLSIEQIKELLHLSVGVFGG